VTTGKTHLSPFLLRERPTAHLISPLPVSVAAATPASIMPIPKSIVIKRKGSEPMPPCTPHDDFAPTCVVSTTDTDPSLPPAAKNKQRRVAHREGTASETQFDDDSSIRSHRDRTGLREPPRSPHSGTADAVVPDRPTGSSATKLRGSAAESSFKAEKTGSRFRSLPTLDEVKFELRRTEAKIQRAARLELELLNRARFLRQQRHAMMSRKRMLGCRVADLSGGLRQEMDLAGGDLRPPLAVAVSSSSLRMREREVFGQASGSAAPSA